MVKEISRGETYALPDRHHWSGNDFERYLVKAIHEKEFLDTNLAPGVIDLSESIIGGVADKLEEKLKQGKRYEYGAEIRLRRNGGFYATDLATNYQSHTTETRTPMLEMKDFIKAAFYQTRGFSSLWEKFPPEMLLFTMHSHPVDVPTSSTDTCGLLQTREEDWDWEIAASHSGILVVCDSMRMITLVSKQTPVFNSLDEYLKILNDVLNDFPKPGISKKVIHSGQIPADKYPEYLRRHMGILMGISHKMNFLMYASKDSKDNKNVYTRSY